MCYAKSWLREELDQGNFRSGELSIEGRRGGVGFCTKDDDSYRVEAQRRVRLEGRRVIVSSCAQYIPYIVDKVDVISVVQVDENADYLRGEVRAKGVLTLTESRLSEELADRGF